MAGFSRVYPKMLENPLHPLLIENSESEPVSSLQTPGKSLNVKGYFLCLKYPSDLEMTLSLFSFVQRLSGSLIFDVLRRIVHRFLPTTNAGLLEDKGLDERIVGLANLGNTCFMNSVLQALASSPKMVEYLQAIVDDWESPEQDVAFIHCLSCCLYEIRHHSPGKYEWLFGSSYRPTRLFRLLCMFRPSFSSYDQQDAHECLQSIQCHVLEESEEEKAEACNPAQAFPLPLPQDSGILRNPCKGLCASQITCTACNTIRSSAREVYTDISLPIPTAYQCLVSQANSFAGASDEAVTSYASIGGDRYAPVHIRDCLRVYTTGEKIDNVHCAHCAANTASLKAVKISMPLPEVLCLHLSRRIYSASKGKLVKIQAPVEYTMELDIAEFCETKSDAPATNTQGSHTVYRLRSVVQHTGNEDFGHYSCYVSMDVPEDEPKSRWLHISDSYVSRCSEEEALSAQAFLLFYEKMS